VIWLPVIVNVVVETTVVVIDDGAGVSVVDGVKVTLVTTVGNSSVPLVVVVGTLTTEELPNCVRQSSSV
jgi:hypothetical protein